jgi:hypothetical protein
MLPTIMFNKIGTDEDNPRSQIPTVPSHALMIGRARDTIVMFSGNIPVGPLYHSLVRVKDRLFG